MDNNVDKPSEGCLLHFNKETCKINVIKKQTEFDIDVDFDNV